MLAEDVRVPKVVGNGDEIRGVDDIGGNRIPQSLHISGEGWEDGARCKTRNVEEFCNGANIPIQISESWSARM